MTTLKQRAEAVAELAAKATSMDLETAEVKDEGGFFECPACSGEGMVEGDTYYNYSDKATGVQFFGVGPSFQNDEALFRAFPEMLSLVADQQAEIERLTDACRAALFTIQGSCEPRGNPDVGDKAEIASTLAMLRAVLSPQPNPESAS